jgi:hypothetical protein
LGYNFVYEELLLLHHSYICLEQVANDRFDQKKVLNIEVYESWLFQLNFSFSISSQTNLSEIFLKGEIRFRLHSNFFLGETCSKWANPRSSISPQKNSGEILPIWASFPQISKLLNGKFDEIRPN